MNIKLMDKKFNCNNKSRSSNINKKKFKNQDRQIKLLNIMVLKITTIIKNNKITKIMNYNRSKIIKYNKIIKQQKFFKKKNLIQNKIINKSIINTMNLCLNKLKK